MPLTKRQKVGVGFGIGGLITAIVAGIKAKAPPPGPPPPPTRVHGRVTDKVSQHNIPGALVEVVGTRLSDITDAGGSYHIDDAPSGDGRMRFSALDYQTLEIKVNLKEGINNIVNAELETAKTVGSIIGKLEELDVATGYTSPMGNVEVTVDGDKAWADSEGYFAFIDMPFKYYGTLTVNGYRPYPLNLDLKGDADLRVVEMIPVVAEFVIHLIDLSLTPTSVAVGQTITITCQATLFIAPVNQKITRAVTLTINGVPIETRDITLTRTSEYWPASTRVYFEFTPTIEGIYDIELDGLPGAFEATPPVNYLALSPTIEKVADFLATAQQWKDWKDEGIWIICPLCGDRIQGATCVAEGRTDWSPWRNHLKLHRVDLPPIITLDEYRYWILVRPEPVPETPLWHCLIDYLYSTYGAPPVGYFELTNIHDAGFDGRNAWFDVDVAVSRWKYGEHWTLTMVAIREEDYEAFLADVSNPYRACDDEGCSLFIIAGPEGRPVPVWAWPWWTATLETESGAKALPITKSGRYGTLVPFEGYIKEPDGVVTRRYYQPLTFETSWTCPICGEVLSLVVPYVTEDEYTGQGWYSLSLLGKIIYFWIKGTGKETISYPNFIWPETIASHLTKQHAGGYPGIIDDAFDRIYRTEYPAFHTQVQNLPPGNYVILLNGNYGKNSWGIFMCTLWEIGRISF